MRGAGCIVTPAKTKAYSGTQLFIFDSSVLNKQYLISFAVSALNKGKIKRCCLFFSILAGHVKDSVLWIGFVVPIRSILIWIDKIYRTKWCFSKCNFSRPAIRYEAEQAILGPPRGKLLRAGHITILRWGNDRIIFQGGERSTYGLGIRQKEGSERQLDSRHRLWKRAVLWYSAAWMGRCPF